MARSGRRKPSKPRKAEFSERYLPVRAEPGMFNGELLLRLNGLDPEQRGETIPVQMLADEREVVGLEGTPSRNNPVKGWLRVTLVNEHGGISKVILPQPAQPVGESLLVESMNLRATAGP